MVLVDSDILIEVIRGRDSSIVDRWMDLSSGEEAVSCSPVTVVELWHGARPNEHETLMRLFQALLCLPIDQEIGRLAGQYLSKYAGSHGLQIGDALIAATASAHRAKLWTRNRKHFPMRGISFFEGSRGSV